MESQKIKNQKRLSIEVLKLMEVIQKIKEITNYRKFTNIDSGLMNLVLWAKKYLDKI